jgi:hypothetical protein
MTAVALIAIPPFDLVNLAGARRDDFDADTLSLADERTPQRRSNRNLALLSAPSSRTGQMSLRHVRSDAQARPA